MNRVRILLADDHVIFLEALKKLMEPAFQVVGTATNGRQMVEIATESVPDVVVADMNMPTLNGLEACAQLVARHPKMKVIFLTVNEDADCAEEAIRRGAAGYLLKNSAAAELLKAIQVVASGRIYITPSICREPVSVFVSRAINHAHREPLTLRQREVLQLLAEGKSMKEAASILSVTPRTIAFHKYSMMQHLGLTRSSELVRYAADTGLCRHTPHFACAGD